MTIRIVHLGTKRTRGEGLRVGTVRRPPRGVPKKNTHRKTGMTCGSQTLHHPLNS